MSCKCGFPVEAPTIYSFVFQAVPSFTFGEDEPPLVWPWSAVRPVTQRTPRERKKRLSELMEALITRSAIEQDVGV